MMKKPISVHPFLFAAYPVLFLYAHNIRSATLGDALTSMALALGLALVLWAVLGLVLRHAQKAAIGASMLLVLFFSYGHVHSIIDGIVVRGVDLSRPRYLLALWALLAALGFWTLLRTRRSLQSVTSFLNVVAIALVAMSLLNIAVYEFRTGDRMARDAGPSAVSPNSPSGTELPDIYYIILDGYASASTLQEVYGFDNAPFLVQLQAMGFQVASESVSNYAQTFLSLASSLNMRYLEDLVECSGADSEDRSLPYQLIRNSEVLRFVKAKGYRFVNLRSGWGPTDRNEHADLDIACGLDNEFLMALAQTTALQSLQPYLLQVARNRVLCAFATLPEVPGRVAGPRFVLAHITVPHPPFLFGAHGEPVTSTFYEMTGWIWTQQENYVHQVEFVNTQVLPMLERILSNSERPPVIILQADHGPASTFSDPKGPGWDDPTDAMFEERMRILNAYYLPQGGSVQVYDSITPVNTFRLIFNTYLGAGYDLLQDRSYYSSYKRPYRFRDVTDLVSHP